MEIYCFEVICRNIYNQVRKVKEDMKAKRLILIIENISSNNNLTMQSLSQICGVSYKTIQNSINDLNTILAGKGLSTRIKSQRNKGCYFEPKNSAEIQILINDLKETATQWENDNRLKQKIAFRILFNRYTKIDDLCDEYFISKTGISSLIKAIRRKLSKFNIEIVTKPYYGMTINASEKDIRKYISKTLIELSVEERCDLCEEKIEDITSIYENAIVLIKDYQYPIVEYMLDELLMYLHTAYLRIKNEFKLIGSNDEIDPSRERVLADKLYELISKEKNSTEVVEIYNLLLGMRQYDAIDSNLISTNKERIEQCIDDIVTMVHTTYGFNIAQDIELYSSLSLHLASLINRAQKNYYAFNPIIDEIKSYWPLPFEMGIDASEIINQTFNVSLSENEIGYISIYLHLALERLKVNPEIKRVLAVCPSGRGMSQLVKYNIEKQFGKYVSVLHTCSYRELKSMDFSNYDYIFSIEPLEIEVPVPVILFPLQSKREDVIHVEKQLINSQIAPLLVLTPESLFFHISGNKKETVIKKIIKKIGQSIQLNDDFYDQVMERESKFSTEMENGIAFPHPMSDQAADNSFLSVSVLDKPFIWNSKPVRIIMMAFIKKGDSKKLQAFYAHFAEFVASEEYTNKLVANPTYETYCFIAKEIERGIEE